VRRGEREPKQTHQTTENPPAKHNTDHTPPNHRPKRKKERKEKEKRKGKRRKKRKGKRRRTREGRRANFSYIPRRQLSLGNNHRSWLL
jgi:hypothetical protein